MLKKLATTLILFLVSCSTSNQTTQKLYLDLYDDNGFLTLEQKNIILRDLQNILECPVEQLKENQEVNQESIINISISKDEITNRSSYDFYYGAISISYSNVKTDFNSLSKYIKESCFLIVNNKELKALSAEEQLIDDEKELVAKNKTLKETLYEINATDGINRKESKLITELLFGHHITEYMDTTGPIEKTDFYIFQGKKYGNSDIIYEIEIDKKSGAASIKTLPISYKNFDSFKKAILENLPPSK